MPPRPPKPLTRGRWRAIALSLLVHACIVAAAVFGWFTWKRDLPPPTLAIEATVIDERALKGVEKAPEAAPAPEPTPEPPPPEPTPEPPPPEEQGPPKPDPAELARKQEEDRLAAEKLEAQKQEQEQEKKAEQERLDTQKKEQERIEAERQAAEKAAEKLAAEKKVAAEKKRAEDAAAAKKAAEEKVRQAREAELRRALEAEARATALRNSDEAARWQAQIAARIQRAWIRPPSAQPGIACVVRIRQVPGGEVTNATVESCDGGDAALRESIQTAAYRASPLPPPPDPAIFDPDLRITFTF